MTTNSGNLLSLADVCKYLKVAHGTVRRLVKAGVLPVIRIGRVMRFDPVDVEKFTERHREG